MTTQHIVPEIVEKHAEAILSAIASATISEVILREYLDDSQVRASVTLIFDNGTTISIADTVSSYPIADTLPGQRVTAVVASRNEDGYWGLDYRNGRSSIFHTDGNINPADAITVTAASETA